MDGFFGHFDPLSLVDQSSFQKCTQIRKRQIWATYEVKLGELGSYFYKTKKIIKLIEFYHFEEFVCANGFLLKIHFVRKLNLSDTVNSKKK